MRCSQQSLLLRSPSQSGTGRYIIRIMNVMLRKALASAGSLVLCISLATAQVASEKVHSLPPKESVQLPFKIGEALVYNVRFSKLVVSGIIGELKLTVSSSPDSTKPELIELKAEAVSKGFFPALFGMKVKDRYISLVNQTDFGMHASTKILEEGKVRREQTLVVNRETGTVTYTDRDLANSRSAPSVKERPSPTWVQDLLSAIYYVRTQPLKEADVIAVPISDGGETYEIEVLAVKREGIKTSTGNVQAIQLNARVFDGRYVKRSGEMLVWLSDDPTRTPLRARIKTSGATINVELKRTPSK
jgi:hypothetical protein